MSWNPEPLLKLLGSEEPNVPWLLPVGVLDRDGYLLPAHE
jgi:hypothetical protein